MIYVASPYSTPIRTVLEERVRRVTAFTAKLIEEGAPAFSPIVYFHPMAQVLNLPTDAQYWHYINMAFMRKADAVFLLRLVGWEQSKGVQAELKLATALGIPVEHFSPEGTPLQ